MMGLKYELEICANSVVSALNAQLGGADRVELCQNLERGGVTPSAGQIRLARAVLHIGLHILIRPREGDFVYSDLEFEEMKADVAFCKQVGCDGVVVGLLHPDGRIDTVRTEELVTLASPMQVTFHRAFDKCSEAMLSLEQVISCGCVRLLTSGMKDKAYEGRALIAELVKRSDGRIDIMAGSGIDEDNIEAVALATGAFSFHTSAKMPEHSAMVYRRNEVVGMDESIWASNQQKIRRIADILKCLNA